MKRIASLVLALAMTLSFGMLPSFADEYFYGIMSDAYCEEGTLASITNFKDVCEHFNLTDEKLYTHVMISTNNAAKQDIVINLTDETIFWEVEASDAAPAFVSFDNGGKWSALKFSIGTPTAPSDFSKFLNKESTIKLTTALDPKSKQPQKAVPATLEDGSDGIDAAVVWSFGKINARPKLEKFSIDYRTLAENGENGAWTLKKEGSQTLSQLEIAYAADKKTPTRSTGDAENGVTGYGSIVPEEGVFVIEGNKPGEKITFLVRVAATANSAASKPKKFGISTLIKAPNLKVDYKKGIIKMNANMILGDAYCIEDPEDSSSIIFVPDEDHFYTLDGVRTPTPTVYTKESPECKAGFPIAPSYGEAYYAARTVATEKKPASLIQVLTVAPRSDIYETDVTLTIKGITIKLNKGYEAVKWEDRESKDAKWKASIKAESNGLYAVRLKNTAKYNVKNDSTSGTTASGNLILDVLKGKNEKGKDICAAAVFVYDDGKGNETASYADSAIYVPAAELFQTVKVGEDNTFADAVTVTPKVFKYWERSTITYTTSGLKSVLDEDEELDEEILPGDTSEITITEDDGETLYITHDFTAVPVPLEIIPEDTEIAADGEIVISFTSSDSTFYAPTITLSVTGYKEPPEPTEDPSTDPSENPSSSSPPSPSEEDPS